ncbi:MAG TPA: 16S rRNA (cytosine(1402)-N(4))-methyltransferase [Cellvibrio sp.]|nr:16S rRNA (cytosine(1402)-N(4))-methyltransferase [Cellvibrio sp.]
MADSQHITVLLNEAVAALVTDPSGFYVDGTFGRGGHSALVMQQLSADGRLLGIDKDLAAIATAKTRFADDARFAIAHGSFAELAQLVAERDMTGKVAGVLLDLGVSSPQLDEAERGFSFMQDGPLDMRMDNSQGETAAEWLLQIEEEALANIIFKYGEERYSRRIAKAIKNAGLIETTGQLAEIVKTAHPKWEKHKHPATRTFQAIRIAINKELEDIDIFLPQAVEVLKPEGRLVVISFHSLEDRLIKQFIQKESSLAEDTGWGLPQVQQDTRRLKKIARIRASEEEVKANPRSRSAWLRVAEKLA